MQKQQKLNVFLACALFFALGTDVAVATPITCGIVEVRLATLDSAESCETGVNTNPGVGDINADYPPGPWSDQGELTGNGTNDYLTVNLTSGSWGNSDVAGTWAIAAAFWDSFSAAVISMHVGHGNGDPDYFAWLITPGETSGTFSYKDFDGRGGGLSNIRLWGGGSVEVPEPGTLGLFGLALLGIGLVRRRRQ